MEWTILLVASGLLGQAGPAISAPSSIGPPAAVSAAPAAASSAPAGADRLPSKPREVQSNPGALFSSLSTLPAEVTPAGRWIELYDVLLASSDRRVQLGLIQAYWNLSMAVAHVCTAWDEKRLLEDFRPHLEARRNRGQVDEPLLDFESRLAASQVRLQDAEMKLLTAQQILAERMDQPHDSMLPLPVDPPFTGGYATRFETIYAGQPVSAQARLLDRALPLRRKSVDLQAAAAQAAYDLVNAEREAYVDGMTNLASGTAITSLYSRTMSGIDALSRQRREFLAAVRQYNNDIAAYALEVPVELPDTASLVGMLINPNRPIWPSRARVRRPALIPAQASGPILRGPITTPADATNPSARSGPAAGGLSATASSGDVAHTALSPVGPPAGAIGQYPALLDLTPGKRALELTSLLNWDRYPLDNAAASIRLEECLASTPEAERRAVIVAYWRARESAARYQLVQQEIEQLDTISNAASRLRQEPAGSVVMLQLRLAQLRLQAELIEARLRLLVGQFALTQVAQRPVENTNAWLYPATAPHGGGYHLRPEAQPRSVTYSQAFRRAVTIVPALHRTLEERATAVVAADMVRAELMAGFEAGQQSLDKLLAGVTRQGHETREFLATLTQYNLEIADYVLAVLPPPTPAEVVTSALVTKGAGPPLGRRIGKNP